MSLYALPLFLLLALAACAPHPEQPDAASQPPVAEAPATEPATVDSLAVEVPSPRGEASGEDAEPSSRTAATDPPTITTVRMPDGMLATLTFRTEEGVSVSDSQPLVFVVDGETFEAPLDAGPARFTEPGGVVVDQASYTLSDEAYRVLLQTNVDAVTVRVADGDAYRDFPYVSGDLIE